VLKCNLTKTHKTQEGFTMNNITQITEKLLENFFSTNITDGIPTLLETMNKGFKEFCVEFIRIQLEELDANLFENKAIRKGWAVVHKDIKRSLICECGTTEYRRRYYEHEETGCKAYLADVLAGIEKGSKIETGLALKLVELATDNSYEKSSRIACGGAVSKQSVMKKARQIEEYSLPQEDVRLNVTEIHIQADEDHVSMQDGRNTIVKLATIHEPRKQIKKKAYLPHKRHHVAYKDKPNDFWSRVSEDIVERYGSRENLKVYIHGDGASWIKTGMGWIPNSTFIIDKYHLHKYVDYISCNNLRYKCQVFQYLRHKEYSKLRVFIDTIIGNDELDEIVGEKAYNYLKNNREGIRNLYKLEPSKVRTCTEGQVSHVLSDRLSRKPCAWMDEGLETISQLRIFQLNGGKLTPDNMKRKDEALEAHESKLIEMRTKAAPNLSYHNIDINKYIPKRSDNRWLKGIANTGGSGYYH